MGAIFLYNKSKDINAKNALKHFEEAGFSDPDVFEIGRWKIYAYSKMCGYYHNIIGDNDTFLISIGTPVYKSLGYSEGLYELLKDYKANAICFEKLVGQYNIFFCHNESIEILFDPMGSKHLFIDNELNIISSHMLAICKSLPGNLIIRKESVYEKLLSGFIMTPNTIFKNILQFNSFIQTKVISSDIGISFITFSNNVKPTFSGIGNREQCIYEQAEVLLQYFECLKKQGDDGIDAGLSGGYDSRLILACMNQSFKNHMHLHTHSTENIHKSDLNIAKKMAEYVNVDFNVVPTLKLEHCDQVFHVIRNSVLYFDGRSSYSIGGCGEVYTAQYRKESTENTPFTLTGIGGELYRNVFCVTGKKLNLNHLIKEKVFSSNFSMALPRSIYKSISEDLLKRIATRLGIKQYELQSPIVAHRYYCEIMMPDGQGNALDAYNQVSCCIAPFIDKNIILKGYETIKFHGSGGDFEGDLIGIIDPGLAAIESSYGYPLNKRTKKAKIKETIRMYVPSSIWGFLSYLLYSRKKEKNVKFNDTTDDYKLITKEAYQYFSRLFPEIDIHILLKSEEDRRRVQFLAMTLFMFKERICLSE